MIEIKRDTPAERIADIADAATQSAEDRESLVALLAENLPLYAGRGANEVSRMRGYILAAFERIGLPDSGLSYVLEELESGHSAYLVAAAAMAARGMDEPTEQLVPFLLGAVRNIRTADDSVSFDSYLPRWSAARQTTGLTEIFLTFAWLGGCAASAVPELEAMLESPAAPFSAAVQGEIRSALAAITAESESHSCCDDGDAPRVTVPEEHIERALSSGDLEVTIQDQDGGVSSFKSFFRGKPAVLTFFYTRCDNPNKCSLTITKLARLQALAKARGVGGAIKTAAITYDPEYDLPPRMKAYGLNRGLQFGDDDRMFRATAGFPELSERLGLRVNFSRTTINRHRLELHVLDNEGNIASSYLRMQWEPEVVLDSLRALLT